MREDEPRALSPAEEQEMRAAIRGLAELRPDPGFRESLKAGFLAGTLESRPAPGAAPRTRAPRRALWAMAAAAVIAALALVRVGTSSVPWTVQATSGSGRLQVEGDAVLLADHEGLEQALRAGGSIEMPPDASVILAGGPVQMELTADLRATLPPPPRRWLSDALRVEVHRGELRVAVGPGLPGGRLRVQTEDGLIEVTGTIFSVVCDEEATCVCVLEGQIRVGPAVPDMDTVPAGKRMVLFRDGRPPLVTDSAPVHRDGLEEFRARLRPSAP